MGGTKETKRFRERKEVFATNSGIPVKRVYTPGDISGLNYDRDLGMPGEEPYTRGIYPSMYRGKLWTIRQFSGLDTPEATNERFKYEYENGITGFAIAMDNLSIMGHDPNHPLAEAEVAAGGVSLSNLQDMETIFEGLPIGKISAAVIPLMTTTCPHTAMYFALAEKRGIKLSDVDGTTEGDPVSFAACGPFRDSYPPRHLLRLGVDLVEWCAINVPKWHPVSFTSYNYRETGVNAYQEIAGLVAAALDYIEEELKRKRLAVDDFVPKFTFHLSAHNDFFEEIAKYRAARRLWYRLMKERYGARNPNSLTLRFHVQTAGSTHTYQQPLNNIVRIAYQVLAAALGGAQSIHANSFDEAICTPTEKSVLMAIRTQQIAQLETNIANVIDPLGGSYYIEWLTNEIEEKAREYLQKIEEQGGWFAALESGWLYKERIEAQREHTKKLAGGELNIVGVNCYEMAEEPYEYDVYKTNPKTYEIQRAKFEKLKRERDNDRVQKALSELARVSETDQNVMPAVMESVKAYAGVGEICDVWRKVYGVAEQRML
ncbi:MAG: methylmalonyl-CoA mutase [Peptococcaceae bacterium]|nr:MAG: methylmalonyl-CoA mutase [Peptococcaceae bacterium]